MLPLGLDHVIRNPEGSNWWRTKTKLVPLTRAYKYLLWDCSLAAYNAQGDTERLAADISAMFGVRVTQRTLWTLLEDSRSRCCSLNGADGIFWQLYRLGSMNREHADNHLIFPVREHLLPPMAPPASELFRILDGSHPNELKARSASLGEMRADNRSREYLRHRRKADYLAVRRLEVVSWCGIMCKAHKGGTEQ
jgi:hypothetical protein